MNRQQRRYAARMAIKDGAEHQARPRETPIEVKMGKNDRGQVVVVYSRPIDNLQMPPANAIEHGKALIALGEELLKEQADKAAQVERIAYG